MGSFFIVFVCLIHSKFATWATKPQKAGRAVGDEAGVEVGAGARIPGCCYKFLSSFS